METKTENKPISVYVAVVTGSGMLHMNLVAALLNILADSYQKKEYEVTIRFSKAIGVDHNRNQLVQSFLKEGKWEWLLMIDDDNPPFKNPLDLIKENKDVMCFPTLVYRGDLNKYGGQLVYNVYRAHKDEKGEYDGWTTLVYDTVNKIEEVDRAGTGCMLIRRNVLESIQAPFLMEYNKDGLRHLGEDILFCDKVKKAGYKIWVDWEYGCSHYKLLDLLDVAGMMLHMGEKKDAINKSIEASDVSSSSANTENKGLDIKA